MVTDDFKEKIESRIADYETRSSVEFVPVIVQTSGDYGSVKIYLSLLVALLVLLGWHVRPGAWGAEIEALTALATGLAVFALLGIPSLLRAFVPAKLMHIEVEEAAAASFLREEVFSTRKRTGLLIFISVFERSVFIVADKGITSVVPAAEWAGLGQRLAQDFARGNPGVTFLSALDEVVAKLANKFPPDADNPDELSNRVRH